MVFKLENKDRRPYITKIKSALICVFRKFPKEPSDEPTLKLSRETLVKYSGEIERLFYGKYEQHGSFDRYKEDVQTCIEFFHESVKKLPDDIRYWDEGLRQFTSYPDEPNLPSSAPAPSAQAPSKTLPVSEQAPIEASKSSTPIKTATEEPPVPVLSSPTPPKSSSRHDLPTTSSPGPTSPAPMTSSPLPTVPGPVSNGGSTPKSSTPLPPASTSFASIMRLAGAEARNVPDSPSPGPSTTRQKATPSPVNGIKSLMSMMMEERAARTQAQVKQRQMQETILQRLTALEEGSRSRHTEAADARAKEFAEREAAVSSREGAIKEREEQLQTEKAQVEKTANKLAEQQKAHDAKEKELSEREAKVAVLEKHYAEKLNQLDTKEKEQHEKDAHIETKLDNLSKTNITTPPSTPKQPANSPRSRTKQKVAHLTSLIPSPTAIIKLRPLEKGRLRASLSGLKSPSFHSQMTTVLKTFGATPLHLPHHATKLIDLFNFGAAIAINTEDSPYQNLHPAVKNVAIVFVSSFTSLVFEKGNWRDYDLVCGQHQIMGFIQRINCLQGARALLDWDLVHMGVDDEVEFEFEDEVPARAEHVVRKYWALFTEYVEALAMLRASTPVQMEVYGELVRYETREVEELKGVIDRACGAHGVVLE
ncbi:TolA Membrane protein [Pyrenophora teres f. maculata]|nr:TolA Membrane protein [Pyrenophora teres f. maculata]